MYVYMHKTVYWNILKYIDNCELVVLGNVNKMLAN